MDTLFVRDHSLNKSPLSVFGVYPTNKTWTEAAHTMQEGEQLVSGALDSSVCIAALLLSTISADCCSVVSLKQTT